MDDVLRHAVQGISDLITMPGVVNVDFADVRAIMQETGSAIMGIGRATGEDRAVEAAKMAINSPLLEISMEGARGVLFNVSGGEDLTMSDVNEAAKVITENLDPEAKIIFGAVHDAKLKKGEVKVTVIATGFPNGGKSYVAQDEDETPQKVKVTRPPQKIETKVRGEEDSEDSSYLDIPAFIRRKMR